MSVCEHDGCNTCKSQKRAVWVLGLELRSPGLSCKGTYLLSPHADPVNNLIERDALLLH